MKVLLWILAIISIIIALLIGGGFFVYNQFKDGAVAQIELGQQIGSQGTFESCITEVADQALQCDGLGCIVNVTVFAQSCAESTQNFDVCQKLQTADQQSSFSQRTCEAAGTPELCQEAVKLIYDFCPAS